MAKIKKTFLLSLLAMAFLWMAHSLYIFINYTMLWGDMKIENSAFYNQILLLILKNVPTIITILVVKSRWD